MEVSSNPSLAVNDIHNLVLFQEFSSAHYLIPQTLFKSTIIYIIIKMYALSTINFYKKEE